MGEIDKRTELIKDYFQKIYRANKEAIKKELFKDLLNRLYSHIPSILEVIDSMSLGAEQSILKIPRNRKVGRGSADTLYNNVIIEFENDLNSSLNHAKQQLAGYLLGQYHSGKGYNFTLIASDFVKWRVYHLDKDYIQSLDDLTEETVLLKEAKESSFVLNEENLLDFYYWIDRFLFREEKQQATLHQIEACFGETSGLFLESYGELQRAFNDLKKFGEIQVSYEQWEKFLSFAYGSFEGSESHFLIHTYLSIFAKMLAYSVLTNDDYIDDEEIRGIIDGTIFNKYNLRNFVDNDFFHWVKTERALPKLRKVFRLISQEIATFDFSSVEEDVLKGVYQELIDIDTRHALGEYYTPDWLCEKILNEFEIKKGEMILDPSCGSGSFLRAAVHRIKTLHPKARIDEINNSVFGIDIHPLSVLIAKTTMLLALGKEVVNLNKPIQINVILANTLLTPDGVEDLFGKDFVITIDKEKLSLNSQILEDVELFDDALELSEQLAQEAEHSKPLPESDFATIIKKKFKHKGVNGVISSNFYKVYNSLLTVKKHNRNGIWKFIVQNLYKPYFLSSTFDYIIGNPPWFTYSSIKNKEYQEELSRLAEKYNLKPEKQANFPHLEIAAIFLSHCSSYFLKKGGSLAFVLPRSIFYSDHHDNIRSGKAAGFTISQLWDLQSVSPLFNIPSAVLFSSKRILDEKAKTPDKFPGLWLKCKLQNRNSKLTDIVEELSMVECQWFYSKQGNSTAFTTEKTKPSGRENPYKKLFKQGATIVPRTFYFVELNQETPKVLKDKLLNVKTAESIVADAKLPWKSLKYRGRVESEYLFYTAISRSILPFTLFNPSLVALPIKIEHQTVKLLNSVDLLHEGSVDFSRWMRIAENDWNLLRTEKSEKMSSNDRLNFQRGLTSQNISAPFLVLYNSSAKNANATVVKRKDYSLPFIVESTTYVFFTDNEKLAHYLCSILNSSKTNERMKAFQARGLFGPRHVHKKILDIYYPLFDENNPKHLELAELGKIASDKAKKYLKNNTPEGVLSSTRLGKIRLLIKVNLEPEFEKIDKIVAKLIK